MHIHVFESKQRLGEAAAEQAARAIRDAVAARGHARIIGATGASQFEFLDALTDALGMPRVKRHIPFRLAFWAGFAAEIIAPLIFLRRPPHITRYAVSLVGRSTRFSTARAREELGWKPQVPPVEGLKRTMEWFWAQEGKP